MESELRNISAHMYDFATGLLAHGIDHLLIAGRGAPYFGTAFGVGHVAHAGELLLKAAIAKEHPLLIFESIPKLQTQLLSFESLLRDGKTLAYFDLPDMLWAATGFAVSDIDRYRSFGRLRNAIQHFAVPDEDFVEPALRYSCDVLDPVTRRFWGKPVFEAMLDAWGECDDYLFSGGVLAEAIATFEIKYDGPVPSGEG